MYVVRKEGEGGREGRKDRRKGGKRNEGRGGRVGRKESLARVYYKIRNGVFCNGVHESY
jgi:hypothetical protein